MIFWLVVLLGTTALMLAGIIYLITRIKKTSIISKININSVKWLISVLILILSVTITYFALGYVNTILVVIVFTIFWIVSDVVVYIAFKSINKNSKANISAVLSLIIALIYLISAYYTAHNVVETDYTICTEKDIDSIKIVQITDSHMGTTFDGEGFAKEIKKIEKCNPDIVLITGDYVDGSSKFEDIVVATKALGNLKTKYGVYFCYGNHDRNFFEPASDYTIEGLVSELDKNGIKILQDEVIDLPGGITLVGREDASVERMPISELIKNIDKERYIIDMNHQPNDYDNEEAAGVDLVLSGHTHGGQLFSIRNVGLWIGANDKIYGKERRSGTDFIVSSGISDWALDFKTGCLAEYVVINIEHND